MSDLTIEERMEGYEWGSNGPWTMPSHLERYRGLIIDTGSNPIEWLMSLSGKDTWNNVVLAALCVSVNAQLVLLERLYKEGLLTDAA
jgi:hypothetical protein